MDDQATTGDGHDIEELARLLHEAEHLEPEARSKAAGLLRELAEALDHPSDHAADLTETTGRLVQAIGQRHEPDLIQAARERVEEAVARAEAKAPRATEVALRLIDVLAGIGI